MSVEAGFQFSQAEDRFNRAFNQILSTSKKGANELWIQQVSGVVKNLFAITPPMGGKDASIKLPEPGRKSRGIVINFGEGKARQKTTQELDIKAAFRLVSKSNAGALSEYLAKRTKLKRFRRGGEKILASATNIQTVRKDLEKRSGTTASGWSAAVRKLSVSGIPKWVMQNGSKVSSKCSVDENADGTFSFEAVNGTNHIDSARIERRIAIALNMQANSIQRWLKAYNENLLREALQ